ncbi:indole-3-glycerol-phosphate synthase [Pendulispora albinea]|uniref:indole-3-glycerol-phosphate synthase n=1 Tax=Pendulispora albinea TaxID=2741071 RepID=A0ABZ2M3P7_9BACT
MGEARRERVLDAIVASKRAEIEALKLELAKESPAAPGARREGVAERLARPSGAPLRLLTEIKRKSPSAGALSTAMGVDDRARAYARAGASAISVLCDGPFFGGSYEDVTRVRAALESEGLSTPILAKEFILDPVQLRRASAAGADLALLIVRIVSPEQLGSLVTAARDAGLEPLVEVATEAELRIALATEARLIGVNARDLDTLRMDPARAASLVAAIPEGRVALHLSGLKTPDDVRAVARGRADGALLGEILMRQDDPTALLAELVAAA